MLHNGYLPPVKAAVEECSLTVMATFNDYNDDMQYCPKDGKYIFYVGGNSRNCLEAELRVSFTQA